MACVVAWFCECGSSVRMSFCAAHFNVTAWAGATTSASTSSSVLIFPPLFERQCFFDQRGKVARAERNHLVVEIVIRVVQQASPRRTALAEEHIGARPRLKHVGEVLASHGGFVIRDDVLVAEDLATDLGGEGGLARTVHGRGIAALVRDFGAAAQCLGGLGDDFPHATFGKVARGRLERAYGADQ